MKFRNEKEVESINLAYMRRIFSLLPIYGIFLRTIMLVVRGRVSSLNSETRRERRRNACSPVEFSFISSVDK